MFLFSCSVKGWIFLFNFGWRFRGASCVFKKDFIKNKYILLGALIGLYVDCEKHKLLKGSNVYHTEQVPGNMNSTLSYTIFISFEDLTEYTRSSVGYSVI